MHEVRPLGYEIQQQERFGAGWVSVVRSGPKVCLLIY